MNIDEMTERLVATEQRSHSNTKRIDVLEQQTYTLQDLAMSVQKIAINTESIAMEQAEQSKRLEKLEAVPGEKWNEATRTIFTALVTALIGCVIGYVVGML